MSALFNIRITRVAPPSVHARFEVCHPDQWDVPCNKGIALTTVVEIYNSLSQGIGATAEARRRSIEATEKHPAKPQLDAWHSIMKRWDGHEFDRAADVAVTGVRLEDEVGNPKQAITDPDPAATLVFSVRDPDVLYHVKEGHSFQSAMCDCQLW